VSTDPQPSAARPAATGAPSAAADGVGGGRALAVPADRLLQDWKQAHERALAYLAALGWP
jgi:hypothetical protein